MTAVARRHHGVVRSAGDLAQPQRSYRDTASSSRDHAIHKVKRRRKCIYSANDDFPQDKFGNCLLPRPPQSRLGRRRSPSPLPPTVPFAEPPPLEETVQIDARHACQAKNVAPAVCRAGEFHGSDDDADSLLALLHRTSSSSGRSFAAVKGSQGTASRTQSSQVDPCQLPREDHVLFALECTVSSSSEAIKAPRELSTRITEPVVALATAIDDESETDDAVNALKLKHLIDKLGGPRGSSEPLPNTSLPSTHSSVALDHVIAVVSADLESTAISFRMQEHWQDCMDYLARVVSASCITTFYVGATMDPCRRWTGHAADLWTGRGPMRGHRESYRAMHLVALMMGSDHSRFVEATLIRAGQSMGVSCVISHCLYKGHFTLSLHAHYILGDACQLWLGRC